MWLRFKAWLAREWAAVKKSGTMMFAWLANAAGVIGLALIDLYSDPTINEAIKELLKPEYIPFYILAGGIGLRIVRKANAEDL
jgi:hypothetical protein